VRIAHWRRACLTAQLREPLVAQPEALGLEAKQYQAKACDVPTNPKAATTHATPRIFFMMSSLKE
jgi:hypothetical protein